MSMVVTRAVVGGLGAGREAQAHLLRYVELEQVPSARVMAREEHLAIARYWRERRQRRRPPSSRFIRPENEPILWKNWTVLSSVHPVLGKNRLALSTRFLAWPALSGDLPISLFDLCVSLSDLDISLLDLHKSGEEIGSSSQELAQPPPV